MMAPSGLFAAVEGRDLPDLRSHTARVLVGLGLLVGATAIAWELIRTVQHGGLRPLALAMLAVFVAIYGGLAFAGRTSVGRRHGDLLLLGLALALTLHIAVHGVTEVGGVSPFALHATTIPILFAAFAPWDPKHSLVLGTFACVVPVAGTIATAGGPPPHVTSTFLVGVVTTVAAMAANQLSRRQLRHLHQMQQQLVASDRLADMGRLTAAVAHELKTPVASTRNALDIVRVLLDELDASIGHPDVREGDLREIAVELRQNVAVGEQGLQRASAYLQALRERTRGLNERRREPFRLRDRVETMLLLLAHRTRRAALEVDVSGVDPSIELLGDPGKVDQILANVVGNALDAMEESGVGRTCTVAAWAVGRDVIVRITDDGPGVPAEIRGRIFEPMFSTRTGAGGTGIGLALSREIATGILGGSLDLVETSGARGAAFELRVPRHGRPRHRQPSFVPGTMNRALQTAP